MNKERIKVLYTISNFNTAGSGKVVYDLVRGLDTSKFDVEIACEDNKGAFFKTVEALGRPIHIFTTKTPYKPYYNLLFRVWKTSKFYKKNKYDVIHSWQWSSDWTEALAARLVGVKWLYTKKAMGFHNKHWHIKSYLAHFIITINDQMKDYFPNKKQQALIPLGVDTNYYNPENFKNSRQVDSLDFNIITVANLAPVKEIQLLIKAIHQLNNSTIKLTIVGDCNNEYGREMISLKEELALDNQVCFLGKHLDVRPYIAKSDLFVITSKQEGMPMALVEAMSMGIPVIGSNVPGVNYVLKDFKNLLFKAGEVDAIATKIKEVRALEEKTRIKLGEDLRQYCVDYFGMDTFIKAHENLYTDLVK
ncbi:glycosyltransferase [Xanthomarina sp. F2636L]|uniref:glycosyltransferase n=1 Tax=Xanthomarina sp. F2636L TaxID=2996018 RepID=UPI00225DF2EE|nr:glycosyltransferase [Xanthomarina sp. F2636L]MCX7549372.1 glycosyltransferase [Xanthomarina sp. F2636L]